MATLNLQIATSGDDGTWAEGNSQFIGTAVFTGHFGGAQGISNSFYRFPLSIAHGSTINSAALTFTAFDNYTNSGVNTTIKAIADDNAAAPTTYSDAESASRTTASVTWNAISNWSGSSTYASPDISAVVQEIIDRTGWSSGNYIVLYWEDNGSTSSQYRRAIDYNASVSQAAKLDITYTVGGSAQGAALHHYRQQGMMRHQQPRLILPSRELITELQPRRLIENRLAI